jgi:hypothetical protein
VSSVAQRAQRRAGRRNTGQAACCPSLGPFHAPPSSERRARKASMMKDRYQHTLPVQRPRPIESKQNGIPYRFMQSTDGSPHGHKQRRDETRLQPDWLGWIYCLAAVSKPSCYGLVHLSPRRSLACVARGRSEHGSNRKRGKRARGDSVCCVCVCTAARSRGWKMQACSSCCMHGRLIPHGLVVQVCSSLSQSVRKGSTGGLFLADLWTWGCTACIPSSMEWTDIWTGLLGCDNRVLDGGGQEVYAHTILSDRSPAQSRPDAADFTLLLVSDTRRT